MDNVLIDSIRELLLRDLNKLKQEVSSYKSEDTLWELDGEIKNTAGNLCLHLCGNLQHYIGAVVGQSGYVRNRDAEFSTQGLSTATLIHEIENTIAIVDKTLTALSPSVLDQSYPENVFNKPMTTGYFLIHLAGHLNYHLGQINYHRRLIKS